MNDPRRHAERWIGRTLRAGVMTSAGLILIGILAEFFAPGASPVTDPLAIVHSAWSGRLDSPGLLVLSVGVLVLMLTPVVRVLATLVMFILEKDRVYSLIAAAILTMFLIEIAFSLT